MIKLGMLDPPERVAYTKIKGDEDAWKWATTKRWRNRWRSNRWCCSKTRAVSCRSIESTAEIGRRDWPAREQRGAGLVQRHAAVHDYAAGRNQGKAGQWRSR